MSDRRFSPHIPNLIGLVLLVILGLAWFNRTALYDAYRLRDYTPPAEVISLADQTTMTDKTRRLFYVYHPVIEGSVSFNDNCSGGEKTIVLGCYVSNRGIYLFDVKDERLNGIKQVTAAHEVLHAAYDRLSSSERQFVNQQLNDSYSQLDNQRITETIESYRSAGADVNNELHSILATELPTLTPELETYYARYFTDRQAIVKYSTNYEQAFTQRQATVQKIDSDLARLKSTIDELDAKLKLDGQSLNNAFEALQAQRSSGQVEQYNASVAAYNSRANRYNAEVKQEKQLVAQYNELVVERNKLALEENELVRAIDSRSSSVQNQ